MAKQRGKRGDGDGSGVSEAQADPVLEALRHGLEQELSIEDRALSRVGRSTLGEALTAAAGDEARYWSTIYEAALEEARGGVPDGEEIASALHGLGFTDPNEALEQYQNILGQMRARICDLDIASRESELRAELERRRQRVRTLRPFTEDEINRLRSELKTAESDFRLTASAVSNTSQARLRLLHSLPPFLTRQREVLEAAQARAVRQLNDIDTSARSIEALRDACLEVAAQVRAELERGSTTAEFDEVGRRFRSRLGELRDEAMRVGLALAESAISPPPGVELNDRNRSLRRIRLTGLPEHHESASREAARLLEILRAKRPGAERSVASAQAELDELRAEAERWGSMDVAKGATGERSAERAPAGGA